MSNTTTTFKLGETYEFTDGQATIINRKVVVMYHVKDTKTNEISFKSEQTLIKNKK